MFDTINNSEGNILSIEGMAEARNLILLCAALFKIPAKTNSNNNNGVLLLTDKKLTFFQK